MGGGLMMCGEECVNTATDQNNCGACGRTCEDAEYQYPDGAPENYLGTFCGGAGCGVTTLDNRSTVGPLTRFTCDSVCESMATYDGAPMRCVQKCSHSMPSTVDHVYRFGDGTAGGFAHYRSLGGDHRTVLPLDCDETPSAVIGIDPLRDYVSQNCCCEAVE